MSAISRITAHFDRIGRQSITVPEWEGLVVTWTPLTLQEHRRIYGLKEPSAETAASVLILKAQDDAGKPLFTEEDRVALLTKADRTVLLRVTNAILAAPTVDEAAKN